MPEVSGVRTPVLFISHGAPTLADDAIWTKQLSGLASDLPKPSAILIVSAHWEEAPVALGATTTVPLIHDFHGFEQHYYDVRYPAPGAPRLADAVHKILGGRDTPVQSFPERGLDHGAYVPLVEMFPEADVPVLQMSMPSLNPQELMRMGQKLAPLRDAGVLIVGSGFFTHNLNAINFDNNVSSFMREFDEWGHQALIAQDVDALLDFQSKAPAAHLAHPRTEHFAPLFVALGAGHEELDGARTVVDGFWNGLAKRSVRIA
ncbi:dioxygenase [Streptomyces sp. NPDC091281]|uniref:dioxygenase family protein n=1 Tax=Streptomyces sp. NPDC091281 TaxID=3365985 RepID=UPI003814FF95